MYMYMYVCVELTVPVVSQESAAFSKSTFILALSRSAGVYKDRTQRHRMRCQNLMTTP